MGGEGADQMKTMYRTRIGLTAEIEVVEVEKDQDGWIWRRGSLMREPKRDPQFEGGYFDTWAEAHADLLTRADRAAQIAYIAHRDAVDARVAIREMKDPDMST